MLTCTGVTCYGREVLCGVPRIRLNLVSEYYRAPGWFTRYVLNPQVTFTARLGAGVTITRVLAIKVRKSGEWHTTPVNLLNDNEVFSARVNPAFAT
jgi:hypothetical protein